MRAGQNQRVGRKVCVPVVICRLPRNSGCNFQTGIRGGKSVRPTGQNPLPGRHFPTCVTAVLPLSCGQFVHPYLRVCRSCRPVARSPLSYLACHQSKKGSASAPPMTGAACISSSVGSLRSTFDKTHNPSANVISSGPLRIAKTFGNPLMPHHLAGPASAPVQQ